MKFFLLQENEYLFHCYRYIELNPVRAGMVEHPEDYRWSSSHANAIGTESQLKTPLPLYGALGNTTPERQTRYQGLFTDRIKSKSVSKIRLTTNKGLILSNDRLNDEITAQTDRRVRLQKPEPKPKKGLA